MRTRFPIAAALTLSLALPILTGLPQEQQSEKEKEPHWVWQANVTYEEEGRDPNVSCGENEWKKTARATFKLITYDRIESGVTWEDAAVSYVDRGKHVGCIEGEKIGEEYNDSGSFSVKSQKKIDEAASSGHAFSRGFGFGGFATHRFGKKVYVIERPGIAVGEFRPGGLTVYLGKGGTRTEDRTADAGGGWEEEGTREEQKARSKQAEQALMPQAQELTEKNKELARKAQEFAEKMKNVPTQAPPGVKPGQTELTPEMQAYVEKIMRQAAGGEDLTKTMEAAQDIQDAFVVAALQQMGATELGSRKVVQGSQHRGPTEDERLNGFEVSRTVTWSFSLVPENVEAVLIPEEDYDYWMPRAGKNEDQPANTLRVMAVLKKKGKPIKEEPQQTAKFKFELLDTSKEMGVCLNWPAKKKAKDSYDLKITQKENPHLTGIDQDGQSAESKEGLRAAEVVVTSFDWGGYGRLRVTATLEDGMQVVAHWEKKEEVTELTIPLDENGNHIADAWEKLYDLKSINEDADDDSEPAGDSDTGDGLSLYEEYRGFRISREGNPRNPHVRTDPTQKDVFIFNRNSLLTPWFDRSGLRSHLVDRDERYCESSSKTTNPCIINFNSGWGHLGNEHVLLLQNSYADGNMGITKPKVGVPRDIFVILVDLSAHKGLPQSELLNTVAHELGHATNVPHHGGSDYDITDFRYVPSHGTSFTAHVAKARVATAGGQLSGDTNCIMRYTNASLYERPGGDYKWTKPGDGEKEGTEYPGPDAPGTTFCTSQEGKGLLGNSPIGICRSHFCVNDVKHK